MSIYEGSVLTNRCIDKITKTDEKLVPKYFKFSSDKKIIHADFEDKDLKDWYSGDITSCLMTGNDRIEFTCEVPREKAKKSTNLCGLYLEDGSLFMVARVKYPIPSKLKQKFKIKLTHKNILDRMDLKYIIQQKIDNDQIFNKDNLPDFNSYLNTSHDLKKKKESKYNDDNDDSNIYKNKSPKPPKSKHVEDKYHDKNNKYQITKYHFHKKHIHDDELCEYRDEEDHEDKYQTTNYHFHDKHVHNDILCDYRDNDQDDDDDCDDNKEINCTCGETPDPECDFHYGHGHGHGHHDADCGEDLARTGTLVPYCERDILIVGNKFISKYIPEDIGSYCVNNTIEIMYDDEELGCLYDAYYDIIFHDGEWILNTFEYDGAKATVTYFHRVL